MADASTYGRNLRWAVLVLYRRRHSFAVVFAVVVALVVVYTLLAQPIFRAEAKLLVTVNRAPLAVSPEVNPRQAPIPQVREEDLNSVVAMLGGRELVRDTLQKMAATPAGDGGPGLVGRIARAPVELFRSVYYGIHGRIRPSGLDRRVQAVAERLQITPIRRSNVVAVAFEDPDPAWAVRFLDTFVDGFLDAYARTMAPTAAEAFFETQSGLLATKLRDSERALREYRGRVGIISLEDQRKSVVEALTEAEGEYDHARIELAASRTRLDAITATLPKVSRMVPTGRREVHEATSQLRGHLMLLEVKRADLLQRYTDDSIRVGEIDEQIGAARKALARAEADPTQEHEYGLNKTYETLSVERALESARVEEMKARLTALESQIEQLRDRALAFDAEATDLERLERERAIDQEIYPAYRQQREAARLSGALNQSQILNLAVAAPAATPSTPVRPRLRVNLMLGLLLGFAAGALAAFARDATNGGIDFPEDVEHTSGLDVLGVLPGAR